MGSDDQQNGYEIISSIMKAGHGRGSEVNFGLQKITYNKFNSIQNLDNPEIEAR